MHCVTFNPLRTLGMPNITYIKPEHMFLKIEEIRAADVVLFPEYWQVNTLVYGLKKKIFPSIETFHLGHNKVEMTRGLRATFPEHIPYTEIVANTPDNRERIVETFSYPFVAKEIKNSMGRGVFLIENRHDWNQYVIEQESLYVQEYIPADRDLRVVYVGDQVLTAYWRIAPDDQFHHNVARGGVISYNNIPAEAVKLVSQIAKQLNINHAGFDLLYDGKKLFVLEFNVLFGNQGIQEQGINVEEHIYRYLLREFRPHFPTTPNRPIGGKRVS